MMLDGGPFRQDSTSSLPMPENQQELCSCQCRGHRSTIHINYISTHIYSIDILYHNAVYIVHMCFALHIYIYTCFSFLTTCGVHVAYA